MSTGRMQPVHDVRAFLAERGRKVRGPHSFKGVIKRMPWPYCTRCGLIALRNDATNRAMREQCETWEDDQ
jgi:hypothetical protein